jgi:hypothetical protein
LKTTQRKKKRSEKININHQSPRMGGKSWNSNGMLENLASLQMTIMKTGYQWAPRIVARAARIVAKKVTNKSN